MYRYTPDELSFTEINLITGDSNEEIADGLYRAGLYRKCFCAGGKTGGEERGPSSLTAQNYGLTAYQVPRRIMSIITRM